MDAHHQNTSTLSFDALFRESGRDLYAYVRTLLGDDASAEDVTALAYERAYRKRASFDAGRGSQRGWLFGIARNAALDELRRRKRSAPLVPIFPTARFPPRRRRRRPPSAAPPSASRLPHYHHASAS